MAIQKEKPWACINCNQLNSEWAEKCGRCGAPMKRGANGTPRKQGNRSQQWDGQESDAVAIVRLAKCLAAQQLKLEQLRKDKAATIERCAQVAENEEEAEGEMPPELHLVPLEDAIRGAIRATKKSIAAAIRKLGTDA